MLDLYNYSLLTIFLVGLAAILAAIEIGHWLGVHAGGEAGGNFEARRDAILTEANAIGTTALRARLLPDPHPKEVLGLLRIFA